MATAAPSWANAVEMARPMPRDPPVTSAVRPSSFIPHTPLVAVSPWARIYPRLSVLTTPIASSHGEPVSAALKS